MIVSCFDVFTRLQKGDLQTNTAVVIDVLRASATIVTAVANGCDRIVPTNEATEAVAFKRVSEGNVLLCGEIAAQKVSGFDLGNSPLEYTQDVVENKLLMLSTTNGSVAIKSCAAAEDVLIGSFINAGAVAKKAVELGRDVSLVCAGTKGKFSFDDILAMGCILSKMQAIKEDIQTDDLGLLSVKLYEASKDDILSGLEGYSHYEYLKQLKLYDDLEYCTRIDMFDIVPIYNEGVIVKG